MTEAVLSLHEVWKSYPQAGGAPLHALCDVSLEVPHGCKLAIVGRSGSGKSTLLHLAAGIDLPSRGRVRLLGRDLAELSDRARSIERRHQVGLVFQFFHLLAHLTVRDNVLLPAWIAGDRSRETESRGLDLLERVGLAARAGERVQHLSGGEMQRVAICRALLNRPRLLLADEPTGNLDDDNGGKVMDLLLRLVDEEGGSLIYVTHSPEMARRADGIRTLSSGRLDPQ